jgi:hypothetical protein
MFDLSNADRLAIYPIDLTEAGITIEKAFGKYLKAPPAGVYARDQLEPIMLFDKTYYHVVGDQMVPVSSKTSEITSPVYDENDQMVRTAAFFKNKNNYASTSFLPYRGIMIAEAVFSRTIDDFVRWRRYKEGGFTRICRHFKDDLPPETFDYDYVAGQLLNASDEKLRSWLEGYDWSVFITRRVGTFLYIERYQDYRILRFNELLADGKITL